MRIEITSVNLFLFIHHLCVRISYPNVGAMLSVLLSKTTSTYSPGEIISGDVVIYAKTPCSILDLTVNYCGESSVSLIVSEGEGKSRTCKRVEETDTHLDVLHPLVRSYRGVFMDRGVHTFAFNLTLPKLLPSSYQSPYGQIEYYIRVHFQTSKETENVCKTFLVQALININMFTLCQRPKSSETVKQCGFIFPKIFRLKASVSKTAFVPGEVIPVVVEVINESRQKLCYLFCTLVEKTNVLVQMQDQTVNRVTKKCLLTLAHKVELPADTCQVYSWLCNMPTPANLTATVAASTIVFVTYFIQVSAKIRRVALPPEAEIPVVFGLRAAAPVAGRRRRLGFVQPPGLERAGSGTSGEDGAPSATHPRRRVTVSAQPRGPGPGRPGATIASVARRVSVHLHSGLRRIGALPADR